MRLPLGDPPLTPTEPRAAADSSIRENAREH
jgi:hypothetical protein